MSKQEFEELAAVLTNRSLPASIRKLAANKIAEIEGFNVIQQAPAPAPHLQNPTTGQGSTSDTHSDGGRNSVTGGIILQHNDEDIMAKIQPILEQMHKTGEEITNKAIVQAAGLDAKDRMVPIVVGRVMSYLDYTHKRRGDRNNRRMIYIND